LGAVVPSAGPKLPPDIPCSRPPAGTAKLNIDGAFFAQTGKAGAGMILRFSDGGVIFSACRDLRMCTSALEAELQACIEGMKFSLDLFIGEIYVESDCLALVNMARSNERDASSLCHLVEDLRILLSSDRFISFSKIPRGCNKASHELAQFGVLHNKTQVWLDSVPNVIMDRVNRNCNDSLII
jgi:ribonuclease HI